MSNLQAKIRNNPVIFLFGPTGVGKTELLLHLDSHKFTVVNADSKQVYRHLNIGSAKPEPEVLARIEHRLIDIRDPWEQFNVGDFVHLADEACREINDGGKIPVLCGGTAYYFKHFLFGLPASPPSDPVVRAKVAVLAKTHGNQWCHDRLRQVDPLSAERIHPSDAYRITRALEVFETSGKPLSAFAMPVQSRPGMNPLVIGLFRTKEELDQRIDDRVDAMFAQGLTDEIQRLLAMGATASWPGMQGIGYREFFPSSPGEALDEKGIADLIKRDSKAYAKRQLTFFRSLPGVHWIHPSHTDELDRLIETYLA
jgi:tRNA dimethylallyltransferase